MLVPLQSVDTWGAGSGRFGPELSFGRTMVGAMPGQAIALTNYAHAGSQLSTDWIAAAGAVDYSAVAHPRGWKEVVEDRQNVLASKFTLRRTHSMFKTLRSYFSFNSTKRSVPMRQPGRLLAFEPLEARTMLSLTMLTLPLPQLSVSDNGRFIAQDNGVPFYWQADTAWGLHTRLDFDELVPGTGKNEVEYYFDTRVSQGFNVIHSWLLPGWQKTNTEGDKPFIGRLDNANPVVLNSAFFDNVREILALAESKGLYVAIELGSVLRNDGPAEWWLGGFDAGNSAADHAAHKAKAYEFGWKVAEYLGGFSNIVWGFGQDTVPTRASRVGSVNAANNGAKYVELVQSMAEGVADATNAAAGATFNPSTFDAIADYDTTMMSFHTGATRVTEPVGTSSAEWFHNDAWLDYNMNQGGRRSQFNEVWYDLIEAGYGLSPTKPIYEGEGLFEDFPTWDNPSHISNEYDVRVQAYWTTFAGAFGFTYGNNNVWQLYNPNRYAPRSDATKFWYDALGSSGANDMIHVNHLLSSRPFLSRIPKQTLLATAASTGNERLVATGDSDGSYAFVYSTNGRSFEVKLSELSGSSIRAWWFNPSDGKVYDSDGNLSSVPFETFSNTGGTKNFDPPGSPTSATALDGNDWVLVLDDNSKGYITPGLHPNADFNTDTHVDGDDLAIWQFGYGTASGANHNQGDADLDGDVDGADFLFWQRNVSPVAESNAFQQGNDGQALVSIEAENYHEHTARNGNQWTFSTATSGFAGTGMLEAAGSGTNSIDTGFDTTSPELGYEVNFVSTGTHYVWVRGNSRSSAGKNSVHVGLDGQAVATSDRIDFASTTSAWQWSNNTMDSADATFEVTTAGVHTVNVWMREKGFLFDKIVLTTDPNYQPSGTGPAESPGGPPLIDLQRTDIIPHRGGTAVYPENTLYAYERNLQDGTSLDADIRKTGDGDIVVIHDATTARTTNGNLTVANSTVAELRSLDAAFRFDPLGNSSFPLRGQGITIPTLEAVLQKFSANMQPGAIIWIDLKDDSDFTPAQNQRLYDRLIELIGQYNLWSEVHVEVSSTADADELIQRDSRVKVGFWSNQVDEVRAALKYAPYDRIGVASTIAAQVADEIHAAGKRLHVTDTDFTITELNQLKPFQPESLGTDQYLNLFTRLSLDVALLESGSKKIRHQVDAVPAPSEIGNCFSEELAKTIPFHTIDQVFELLGHRAGQLFANETQSLENPAQRY